MPAQLDDLGPGWLHIPYPVESDTSSSQSDPDSSKTKPGLGEITVNLGVLMFFMMIWPRT